MKVYLKCTLQGAKQTLGPDAEADLPEAEARRLARQGLVAIAGEALAGPEPPRARGKKAEAKAEAMALDPDAMGD